MAASTEAVPSHTADSEPSSPLAPFRWKLTEDGKWARRLWGSELFYHQYAKVTDHTADVIEYVEISGADSNSAGQSLIERCRNAWLRCRFQTPLIAASVNPDANHPARLGRFEYDPIKDPTELFRWLEQSLRYYVVGEANRFETEVERVRFDLSSQAVPDECPTRLHVVTCTQEDGNGRWRSAIILNAPHYLADGSAALIVLHLFLKALGESNDARLLPWGQEVSNLPPTVADAVGADSLQWDVQEAIKMLGPLLAGDGPGLALPPQRNTITGPLGATRRHVVKLSVSESAQLSALLKERGSYTVSHAVDAARHAAVWWLGHVTEGQSTPATSINNILLPIDCTRHFGAQWKGKPYYCSGTAGFSTSIPLASFPMPPSRNASDETCLDRAFDAVLPLLAQQWKSADPMRSLAGVPFVVQMLKVDLESPRHLRPDKPSDAFTSLGVLERLLHHEYSSFTVDNFALCPRMTTPQVCLHTWSFGSQVHLSASYTAHYTGEFISTFVSLIVGILRRVGPGA